MDNNNIDKTQEQGKSFITEKIKPKTRRKIKKVLEVCGLALVAALIIGFVSRIVFVISEDTVNKMLGVEEKQPDEVSENHSRNEVRLSTDPDGGKISPSIAEVPTPSPEPEKVERDEDKPTLTPSPSIAINDGDSHENEDETKNEEGVQTDIATDPGEGVVHDVLPVTVVPEENIKEKTGEEIDPIDNYVGMIGGLKKLYAGVSESVVTVRAYSNGINWLDENIESYIDGTGIILGENGVELLIMTSCSKTENADRMEVILNDGFTVEANYFLGDKVLDIAIVAVKLENITAKEKSLLRCICIGDSSELSIGDSVMAVGMPDGYSNSMAYGYVSATGRTFYVQDGILDVFATGLPYHSEADAVIINMSGEMVGIISHYVEKNEEDGITMCVAINSIREILIGLLNGKTPVRLGLRVEDMPEDVLKSMDIENGIYINEVIPDSPADEAGLKKGDIITEMDQSPITGVKNFMEYLIGSNDRAEIVTTYYRGSLRDEPVNTVLIVLMDAE
ncbi:MAG: S1C family serine protease [Lachnospiraceae bacterium]|nr:S1C family serine protease [Lachnospiraceae bacterium]